MSAMKMSEEEIQAAAFEQYARRGTSNSVLFHIPNGGLRDPGTAHQLKELGVVAGVPDLFAAALNTSCFIEIKTEKGKLRESQKIMHRRLQIAGGMEVITTHGLDQLIAVLERRGVLRANRACIMAA